LQGRNFSSLALLTPGSVSSDASLSAVTAQASAATNGQRPTSNTFAIDGVSANFGIAAGGQNPGASASGRLPALTAGGGASGLATLSSVQEVSTHTSYLNPEFGRVPGAQIAVTTRSGTNAFHGSLFHFFGNDLLDANDWFANSRGLGQPPRRLNNFGGTFDGPIAKNKTFFFGSYEGLRLRQPMTAITNVPSLEARSVAPDGVREFLNAYPIPNGRVEPDLFAEFSTTFDNPARSDAGSIRVDTNPSSNYALTGRYSFANSYTAARGAGGFSLNTTNTIRSFSQTLT